MVHKRDATCPLCGAKLTPAQVLDACEEIADAPHGALSCRCPYCQGHFDVRPGDGRVDLGYLQQGRFDVVASLPCIGLSVMSEINSGFMHVRLNAGDRRDWRFEG